MKLLIFLKTLKLKNQHGDDQILPMIAKRVIASIAQPREDILTAHLILESFLTCLK